MLLSIYSDILKQQMCFNLNSIVGCGPEQRQKVWVKVEGFTSDTYNLQKVHHKWFAFQPTE